ncbi:MAG: fluoride efflux transporter CrcB [Actinomycetota bacterium]|nr:fluoride efflux transporter CrcB [Actinomycetota bacterium]MDQ2958856.1 fluoride efflux transporter CrcB [Actinomycetota bacterium]
MNVLWVFLGGGLGAPARYLLDRWVQARHRWRFPSGTLLVNLIGCLLLGIIAGGLAHRHWSPQVQALLGTGFCGGLTTFSTFSVEAVELLQGRFTLRAVGYLALSCGLGVGLAAVGYALT